MAVTCGWVPGPVPSQRAAQRLGQGEVGGERIRLPLLPSAPFAASSDCGFSLLASTTPSPVCPWCLVIRLCLLNHGLCLCSPGLCLP